MLCDKLLDLCGFAYCNLNGLREEFNTFEDYYNDVVKNGFNLFDFNDLSFMLRYEADGHRIRVTKC